MHITRHERNRTMTDNQDTGRNPPRSYRLSSLTRKQIDELAAALSLSQSNVIQIAVDRMYQSELAPRPAEPTEQ